MKDKRTERLYDCITDVDDQFIQEASEVPEIKSRKKAIWIKRGSIAACLAVAVISAILYFPHSTRIGFDPEPVVNPEHSEASDPLDNNENEKLDWNNPPIEDGEIWGEMRSNGSFASGEKGQTDLSIKPNLEGYQYAKNPDSYEAPPNGAYIMTDSLKAAVKKYGNRVTYRINLDVYKDQNKLENNSTEVQKWFNELNPDITVAYLDYYDGSAHFYNFYMDACSYEDLMAFCHIESEYGFILSLYRESNGDFSEQTQTSPQIFNTPDIAD